MTIDRELLKGSTVIMILTLLERQAMYGYEMIKEVDRSSSGVFSFKEGTLYPVLHALESQGMVESYWVGEDGSRKRKYYRITAPGRIMVKEKQKEWATFSSAVNRVLGVVLP